MMASYLTVTETSQAVYREKMSRFISFAIPVTSPEQAREIIARYTNEYHDARHVCWAYMIGADRTTFLSTDNGEPSGTAGKPILGQINSAGLTDILIIVVRYFGGIKLGTSGLIAAYREAARLAIAEATVVERHETTTLTLSLPYQSINSAMQLIKSRGISIVDQQFDNTTLLTITLPLDILPEITSRLLAIPGLCIRE
ncbi:MAG: YigZ family protein [Duncaniella sp.]|nr:YigZ family protein [Duncaniella sp.]